LTDKHDSICEIFAAGVGKLLVAVKARGLEGI